MRRALALLLCSLPAFGAVAFDNYTAGTYAGATTNTLSQTSSGTNLVAVCFVWYRSGTLSAITYGGVTMTKDTGASHATTAGYVSQIDVFVTHGFTAGAHTFSVTSSGESDPVCMTFNGANQTDTPDANATFTNAVIPGSHLASLPITTVANNSMMVGIYSGGGVNGPAPTSNGTFAGPMDIGVYPWYSTANITPAGSFTLFGFGNPGDTYDALGLSISPPAAAAIPFDQGFVF
jgi:hypothetical protein